MGSCSAVRTHLCLEGYRGGTHKIDPKPTEIANLQAATPQATAIWTKSVDTPRFMNHVLINMGNIVLSDEDNIKL